VIIVHHSCARALSLIAACVDLDALIVLEDEVAPVVAELHTGAVERHPRRSAYLFAPAIKGHCPSESNWKRGIPPASPTTGGFFVRHARGRRPGRPRRRSTLGAARCG
jgi:hypothetical protein